MADATAWIAAIRASHDRITALLGPLDDAAVRTQSYASEWSFADVASHLGSQAEIFDLFLAAGLSDEEPPSNEVFGPIWDRWNALAPLQQVSQSIAANEALVSRIEAIPGQDLAAFHLSMFGMDIDLAGFAGMRLGEHAVHVWDIEVALDPTATIAAQSVELLIDTIGQLAGHAGKPSPDQPSVAVTTTAPGRHFVVTLDAPEVTIAATDATVDGALALPAEAFVRAIYGRLDPEHTPTGLADDGRVALLREVFPGF